jgi:hypothetical protein
MRRTLLLPFAFFLACGSSEGDPLTGPAATGGAGGTPTMTCAPGQQVPCACIGSTVSGVQICRGDGLGFDACLGCPGGSPTGAGGLGAGGGSPVGPGGSSPVGQGGASAGSTSFGGSSAGGTTVTTGGTGGSSVGPATPGGPDTDGDHDGWTPAQGDCNDCDPGVNPGAVDLVEYDVDAQGVPAGVASAVQIDNDCEGGAATSDTACDAGLGYEVTDPFDAARAMGLCKVKVEENPADPRARTWGVIQAMRSDIAGPVLESPPTSSTYAATELGILPGFGPATVPQEGERVFSLSSGVARATGQPGAVAGMCETATSVNKMVSQTYPTGFPKQGSCGTTGQPFDGAALDLSIRVPTNATSFSFVYRFFTCEYPEFVCKTFNDVFAVLMDPSPFPAGDAMDPDVVFELTAQGTKEIIGVNNQSFLSACTPGASGYTACTGETDLTGTGFEKHAGSAWLRANVPVTPGSIIHLRFAIWDSGDSLLDSTVVLDSFRWGNNGGFGTVILPSGAGGGSGLGGFGGGAVFVGAGGGGTGGQTAGSGGCDNGPFGGGNCPGGTGGSTTGGTGGGTSSTGGSGGSTSAVPGPCSDGTCAAAGECCKGLGMACGSDFGGMFCL